MSSGRGVNHLIICLSTKARGVATHGSSTCGLACRRTRCRCICNRSMLIDKWAVWCRSACNQSMNQTCGGRGVTLHDILIMLTAMWSTRCRRTCKRSHAERHTGCHQPEVLSRRLEEFLFELRVVQGRPFRVRHAFEVSWDRRLLEEFKKGFWSRIRARVKVTTNQTQFACMDYDVVVLVDYTNARLVFWVLRGKEGYFTAKKVARVCPHAAGQRGCIKHALYGEVARKHALSCDTLLGLHVSSLDVLAHVPLWLRVRCSRSRM
ncbi:hypothetical protein F2Q68_00005286 [Brassica cretica]|uniref:Uncharacterized protein n=1 Tax=Brassica cretica TaxID=69181 RepID=A0A8S9JD27_BRACR|nr:hypothetical protein F2Q68_00005286 [Brassica cretica]